VEKNCQKRVKIEREMDGQRWSSNVHKVINIQKNLIIVGIVPSQ
jgi:hypothetical protein